MDGPNNGLDRALREIAHEREMRETVLREWKAALDLQRTEYLRRLDELNHAHAQAMENWQTSLPRELFEQWKEEYQKWRETVNLALQDLVNFRGDRAHDSGRLTVIEKMAQKFSGALILLAFMGILGVIAFLIGIARLTGIVP